MNVLKQGETNKQFTRASDVVIPDIFNRRFFTGKEELDNVFGGSGFVPGFTFTLAAAPGTGKTTICLQTLELLEQSGKRTAYVSGEETQEQLAFTSKRINVSQVPLANMTDVDDICKAMVDNKFDFVMIDSLPTLTTREKLNSREKEEYVTTKLIQTAKENEICVGVILHFTKTGTYKGSTLFPHSCDCNLIMTRNEEDEALRDIESTKNRFGSTGVMTIEISASGFTFEKVDVANRTTKATASKTSKRDQVLDSISESGSTVAQIAQQSNVAGGYLTTLLRELCNEGVVEKEGRGPEATYKKQ
jgi:predicted ATP-dependent serine protease